MVNNWSSQNSQYRSLYFASCSLAGKVFLYSSYTIIIHLCEVDGKVPFSNAAVVLVIEVCKLILSLGMFLLEVQKEHQQNYQSCAFLTTLTHRLRREFSPEGAKTSTSEMLAASASVADEEEGKLVLPAPTSTFPTASYARETNFLRLIPVLAPFSVPALLYTITNNLGIAIQMEMDPATYQVLSNFKILSTAILFRLIIRRPIICRQWFALFLLLVAGIINGLTNFDNSEVNSSSVLHITLKGIIMISIYCTVSGFASVYTEYVLKKRAHMSLNLQNATLYVFGIITNSILYLVQDGVTEGKWNLLKGFTLLTWVLVVTQAFSGIFIGFIMKYATNILRLFLISSAMIVTTVLSVLIFGLVLKSAFIISAFLVVTALILYHL